MFVWVFKIMINIVYDGKENMGNVFLKYLNILVDVLYNILIR